MRDQIHGQELGKSRAAVVVVDAMLPRDMSRAPVDNLGSLPTMVHKTMHSNCARAPTYRPIWQALAPLISLV
jgi:hypothetical protein